jgi:SAM-dependent methyltransferase/glycosyltransferase involved in cell wall biosynthesis
MSQGQPGGRRPMAVHLIPQKSPRKLRTEPPWGQLPKSLTRSAPCENHVSVTRTLIILDPNLKNLLGHYFEYDRSVADAAIRKGLDCVILAHRDAALPPSVPCMVAPVYSADIWKTLPGENYHSERNIAAVSEDFASETLEFLAKRPLSRGDILFLPTITHAQLPGAAALAEALGPRGVGTHIMLRYQRAFYESPAAARAFARLADAAKTSEVTLCTDSHRLARDLGSLTALPIQVFPIPHTDLTRQSALSKSSSTAHFVSLGNARGEKGLAEIFAAIRKSGSRPWAEQARFTLQINDPSEDVVEAIASFRKRSDARVTLIDRILSSEEYYDLLQEADVALVPYHRDIYGERTSGVFLEAVTAAKVVLCTRDTWMSDLLDAHGGGIAVRDRSANDLCSAIGEIATNLPMFQERAIRAAAHWNKIHTPENLVAHLLCDVSIPALVRDRTRALVIYPWGDAVEGNSGAAMRLRLLVSYLEQTYGEVRVLFTAVGERGGRVAAKTEAEPYYHMRIRARALYTGVDLISRMLGGKKSQGFHLWFHLWPLLDGRFRARCEELVRWADDVYLEYGYFAPVVGPLCQAHEKRLIVTQYDLVSQQAKGVPFIHGITQRLELGALRGAPRLVVSTEDERAQLAERGIMAELIPHPVDLKCQHFLTTDEAALILSSLYAVPTDGRHICFFVGSPYEPNRKAAQIIRSMAASLREDPRASDLMFVVAGGCMAPQHDSNFIALGKIEEAGLSACYEKTAVVLVPITEGTGSSIKSIEAMARGALVLATSVGMRGIPIEPGRHCLIEDDLTRYPERILQVVGDRETAERIRAEAKAFGAAYDYRQVFARCGFGKSDLESTASEYRDEELREHRRKAIEELLPRLRQLSDADARQRFRDQFGLAEEELPPPVAPAAEVQDETGHPATAELIAQPEPQPAAAEANQTPEPARPPVTPASPRMRRSLLRRITKQVLLLLPPMRVLYQEVLLANARTSAREAEVHRLEHALALGSAQSDLLADLRRHFDESQNAAAAAASQLLAPQFEGILKRIDDLPQPDLDAVVGRIDALVASRHADLRDLAMQSLHRLEHALALGSAQSDLLADLRRHFDESQNAAARYLHRLEDLGFDVLALARTNAATAPAARLIMKTDHPIAIGSADHVHQRGSANDDTRHPPFVASCERHFSNRPIRHLDLGCAGGGLVWDFIQAGHQSFGVEGSDFSARIRRAYWRVVPDHLFTADITEPFTLLDASGNPAIFDVVSAWEVLEHIPETAVDTLFTNIVRCLRPGGIFAASVATFPDEDPATGAVWHVTIKPRDWWLERAAAHGLRPADGDAGFATADFARGSGNLRMHDWDVRLQSDMGFHLLLERK